MPSSQSADRERIERPLWNCYCLSGDPVETKTTVSSGYVDIEDHDGMVQVNVSAREDGIDVRVGNLQLVVKGRQVSLLQSHPPYPISEWSILFQGEMS